MPRLFELADVKWLVKQGAAMTQPSRCPILDVARDYADDGASLIHASDDSPCHGETGKVLQIIPAGGWRGIYAHEADGKAHTSESPVACFALVEMCDGTREVTPLMSQWDEIDRGSAVGNFLGILGPGEPTDESVQRLAEEHVARERAKRANARTPAVREATEARGDAPPTRGNGAQR